jgi:hypothetical protein
MRFFLLVLASFSSSCSSDQTVSSTDLLAQFGSRTLCNSCLSFDINQSRLTFSIGVMEWIIASMCLKASSSISTSSWPLKHQVSFLPSLFHVTHFLLLAEFGKKIIKANSFFSNFLFLAFLHQIVRVLSTKDTTSPIPRFFRPYE